MFKSLRSCSATLLFSTVTMLVAAPVSAGDRLELAANATDPAPSLTVTSGGARQAGLREASLRLDLTLRAQPRDAHSGYKILGSEIYLKQEGPESGDGAKASLEVEEPVDGISLDKDFAFDIHPHGAVAQNALAVCGGLSKDIRIGSMTLPVVWRVRTGRFNFRWLQANVDGPSDEMLRNPDFYADQEIQEFEWPVTVGIACESFGTAIAKAKQAKPSTVAAKDKGAMEHVSAPKAAPRPQKTSKAAEAKSVPSEDATAEPAANEVKGKDATVAATEDASVQTLVCDGGMVRKLSGGAPRSICLCPGNTRRHETGPNEFACERRVGRR